MASLRERERERVNGASRRKGIPIGNLTSQLFANVYMNEFDQFMKHIMKVRHYARYTDDFVIVSESETGLEALVPKIEQFLNEKLHLSLHPEKVSIRPYFRGVDFLGQVVFPHHRLLRTKTRRRIFKKLQKKAKLHKSGVISEEKLNQSLQSYLGALSHTSSYEVSEQLKNQLWFWLTE